MTKFVGVLPLLGYLGLASVALAGDHKVESVSAEDALAKLKEGNARFTAGDVSQGKPTSARRAEIAQAQHPFAVVLGCADSRTSPEIIFDENLGDLFVVRTAGNLVDDHGLGSIEYAVEHLGARLIVVLGHERCGAVKAALGSEHAPGHVDSLVADIQPAVKAAKGKPGDALDATVAANALGMAAAVKEKAELGALAKDVKVVAAVYDLDTGKVEWLK
jgi:carbonic anhydrase